MIVLETFFQDLLYQLTSFLLVLSILYHHSSKYVGLLLNLLFFFLLFLPSPYTKLIHLHFDIHFVYSCILFFDHVNFSIFLISSVIATNKSSDAATIRVWVVPLDQDAVAANHVFISYNVSISGNNSLETFRFPVLTGDKVYVRASTGDISFSLSGIDDTTVTGLEYATLEALILGLA